MLVNSHRDRPVALPGTRLLESTFGLDRRRVEDPHHPQRIWEVQELFSPLPERALGGIRVRLVDQKGFVTFCNQRDFEVLLGMGVPGNLCPWLDSPYAHWNEPEWFGFCCDEEDLRDDLYQREAELRGHVVDMSGSDWLDRQYELSRRVHLERNIDVEDLSSFW